MSTRSGFKGFYLDLSVQWGHTRQTFGLPKGFLPRADVWQTINRALQIASQTPRSNVLPLELSWQAAQVGVRVVNTEEGLALNHQYRAKNYATNVLTFDYSSSPVLCADIVLCAPVLAKEASDQHKDPRAHYAHMLVHGALHALGLDHERSSTQARAMEALETKILRSLGFANPYEA